MASSVNICSLCRCIPTKSTSKANNVKQSHIERTEYSRIVSGTHWEFCLGHGRLVPGIDPNRWQAGLQVRDWENCIHHMPNYHLAAQIRSPDCLLAASTSILSQQD